MNPQLEIIVDNFAGGGGASTGIEMAIGRSVDIAINHDPAAIAIRKTFKSFAEGGREREEVLWINPTAAKGIGVTLF